MQAMSADAAVGSSSSRLSTLIDALPYVLGSAALLAGFVTLYVDPVAAALVLAGGLWLLPVVRRSLLGRVPVDVPAGANVALAVLLVASGGYMVAAGPSGPSPSFRAFEADLVDTDLQVERVVENDEQWVLEVSIPENDIREVQDVRLRAGQLYAQNVPDPNSQPDHAGLHVRIRARAGDEVVAEYDIPADLAQAYEAGEISGEEYFDGIDEANSED